jgi:serine/threonine protein kinase
MERYNLVQLLGEGSFGTVYCAIQKESGEKVRHRAIHGSSLEHSVHSAPSDCSVWLLFFTLTFVLHIVLLSLSNSLKLSPFLSLTNKVAIKILKKEIPDWDAVSTLREFQAIRGLGYNSYIIHVMEAILESNKLYFVCQYMPDGSLNDLIQKTASNRRKHGGDDATTNSTLHVAIIPSIVRQVIQGLEYIHSKGYMHRDLKPENILLMRLRRRRRSTTRDDDPQEEEIICKVSDFSLTRTASPFATSGGTTMPTTIHHAMVVVAGDNKAMTSYVSTRWYRAPEVLLCAPQYSTPVDMWALACIMAELYRLYPLFPGSGEIDQLHRILNLMARNRSHVLEEDEWKEGAVLCRGFGLLSKENTPLPTQPSSTNKTTTKERLAAELPSAHPMAIDLIHQMLQLDPKRRLSASNALLHDYLAVDFDNTTPASAKGSRRVGCSPATLERSTQQCNTKTTPNTNREAIQNHTGSGNREEQRPPLVSVSPGKRWAMVMNTAGSGDAMIIEPIQVHAVPPITVSKSRLDKRAQPNRPAAADPGGNDLENSSHRHNGGHVLSREHGTTEIVSSDPGGNDQDNSSYLHDREAVLSREHRATEVFRSPTMAGTKRRSGKLSHSSSDLSEYRPAKVFNVD